VKEFTLKEFEDIFRVVEVMRQKLWMLTLTSIEACKFAEMWIKLYAAKIFQQTIKMFSSV
jgi:hypothetical protein